MAKRRNLTFAQLTWYCILFLVPQAILFIIALHLGDVLSSYFEASPLIVAKILMTIFTVAVFFFIIPYLRSRESVAGMRYSIIAFFVLGTGVTLPGAITGQSNLLFHVPIYVASYILLTFIYAPEVLGIERNLSLWFKHHRQLFVLFIYSAIVIGYVFGFGYLYFDIYKDNPASFSLSFEKEPGYGTFVYYSIVSFTTIGYGDIAPVSTAARMVTGFSSMLGMIINVVFISILLIFVSSSQGTQIKKEEAQIEKIAEEEEKELELLKGKNAKDSRIHSLFEELRKL